LQPQFTHTVKVRVPVDGGHEDQSFKARFRVVDAEELAKIEVEEGAQGGSQAHPGVDGGTGRLRRQSRQLFDALRDQLLQQTYVEISLYRTYLEAVAGAKTGKARPPLGGRRQVRLSTAAREARDGHPRRSGCRADRGKRGCGGFRYLARELGHGRGLVVRTQWRTESIGGGLGRAAFTGQA
jgi:hypothetical protein